MINHTSIEFSKFVVVGLVSTALNYAVFFVCYQWLGIHYVMSSGLGYMSGLTLGYIINRNWTFTAKKSDNKVKEFSLYFLIYLLSLVLSLATIIVLVDWLTIHPLVANLFAIGVSTMSNFIGLKLIVFRHNNTHQNNTPI